MVVVNEMGGGSLAEQLWRAHSDELVRYSALLVGPHDAQDIVSATFARAAGAIERGGIDNPRAYLIRCVTNEAHHHRRAKTNRWRRDLLAVVADSQPAADGQLDVRRAVAELSVRQRAVVYLAYWEDMSERAIAESLQLSIGSVHRHLTRARAHLRKALDD